MTFGGKKPKIKNPPELYLIENAHYFSRTSEQIKQKTNLFVGLGESLRLIGKKSEFSNDFLWLRTHQKF